MQAWVPIEADDAAACELETASENSDEESEVVEIQDEVEITTPGTASVLKEKVRGLCRSALHE